MAGGSLIKSTGIVGSMTMVSRVLGLVRDMVFAGMFGTTAGTDAFFVAFKIPNFMRRLFAEGAFSQAFVPVFTEIRTTQSHEMLRRFTADVTGTFGGVLLLITLLGVVASPLVVGIFAPGFLDEPQKYQLACDMLRWTFPYLFFISLTALAAGILNSFGQFAVPSLTPVWLNVVLIIAAVWVAPSLEVPVMVLAWAVFVAGAVQLAFQLPFLYRLNLTPRPRWAWRSEGVQRVFKLMLPAIFGSSVAQINLLIDTLIASFLVTGSVSWLYYADRLVEFPLGVFGIALATVILPHLSAKHATASGQAFSSTIDWALRWVLLIGVPATIGLMMLSGPIITTIFHYGQFDQHDVAMAQLSLIAYAVGLLGFILVKVLAPGFYARQDTKTPVRIGVIAMVSNMAMNVLFVLPMVWLGIEGPHAGLALATSVSAFINAGMLFFTLRRQGVYVALPGWRRFTLQILAANVSLLVVLWFGMADMQDWYTWGAGQRVAQLVFWIGAGAAVYLGGLLATGLRGDRLRQLLRTPH